MIPTLIDNIYVNFLREKLLCTVYGPKYICPARGHTSHKKGLQNTNTGISQLLLDFSKLGETC